MDTGVVTLMVTPTNDTPIASDTTVPVIEDSFVDINLASLVTDAEGDNLIFTVMSGPVTGTGTVVDQGNGVFRYTHNGDEVFSDSFTYEVTDGVGNPMDTGVVTLMVTPVNDTPIASDTTCLLYTSPSPRDATLSRMPSSA